LDRLGSCERQKRGEHCPDEHIFVKLGVIRLLEADWAFEGKHQVSAPDLVRLGSRKNEESLQNAGDSAAGLTSNAKARANRRSPRAEDSCSVGGIAEVTTRETETFPSSGTMEGESTRAAPLCPLTRSCARSRPSQRLKIL